MAKAKKNSNNMSATSKVVVKLSTESDMVRKELPFKLTDFYPNAITEQAVIAEDSDGLYLTGKTYVGAAIMDPYRVYKRDCVSVKIDPANPENYIIKNSTNIITV